jgi:putative sterol carrier protein
MASSYGTGVPSGSVGKEAVTVKFLSSEWATEVERALNASPEFSDAAQGHTVQLQQVVTGTPEDAEVKYFFRLEDGRAHLGLGELSNSEATITQSYATAVAINKRELHIQNAFMRGELKVSGNLMKLMQLTGVVTAMVQAIATVPVEY